MDSPISIPGRDIVLSGRRRRCRGYSPGIGWRRSNRCERRCDRPCRSRSIGRGRRIRGQRRSVCGSRRIGRCWRPRDHFDYSAVQLVVGCIVVAPVVDSPDSPIPGGPGLPILIEMGFVSPWPKRSEVAVGMNLLSRRPTPVRVQIIINRYRGTVDQRLTDILQPSEVANLVISLDDFFRNTDPLHRQIVR